jgi:16S rRNA G966 N2-methylase RsmD
MNATFSPASAAAAAKAPAVRSSMSSAELADLFAGGPNIGAEAVSGNAFVRTSIASAQSLARMAPQVAATANIVVAANKSAPRQFAGLSAAPTFGPSH